MDSDGAPHPFDHDALWLSEARYRAIVEDQPDFVCRFLADGTLTYANDAYCRFFGIRREDAIGTRYQPVVHPDDLPAVLGEVASIAPEKPVAFIENRVFRHDGRVRWTEWTNHAIYNEQGQLLEFQSAGRDVTERKEAEEHTARLAAIVASAEDAIYSTSMDGTITSWNRAAERMFGYSADEAIGQPLSIILPGDRADESIGIAHRLTPGETIAHFETEQLARSGERVPVSLTLSPIVDGLGRITGVSRIARDISERRRAERELQERESRFRLMADHAPVLIWLADVNNQGIYFNEPWIDFTGVPMALQLGDGWLSLIHPEDIARAGAYCQEHFERRLPFTMEFRIRHCTGDYRWVQDSGQPLFLPDGTFNGYIGSCVDIHARKEAEDHVRRILEGVSDAFSAVDREWRFTYVNDRYTRLAGKTRDELLGRICWDVFPTLRHGRLYDVFQDAVRNQHPVHIEDYYEPLDLWFETRLYPTPDGLIAFTTDISERKRLEDAREQAVQREADARALAEEASRLKDEFLAIVSHELRTPLNAILGWARMLRDGTLAADAVPKALDTIERNARMQAQLVDDLLDVSSIVSGKLSLEVEPVDLGSVVRAALAAVRPAAASKQIDLQLHLGADGGVRGDAGRLHQAVSNLFTNAIKFTPAGGRVDVQLRHDDTDAVLVVRDTGVGIPPDALPFIFDRFRQADSRTTRAHGGLGLGLTIVDHIVRGHGGSVHAESAGTGHGAAFEIRLPLAAAAADDPTCAESPAVPTDLTGCHILVVDDEPDARELFAAILESRGATVTTAASAAEAVAAWRTAPPDVLVADIGMPGEDGYALIRSIVALRGSARIPAVALTAYAGPQHRDAALRAGYDAHVAKPAEPDELCGLIAHLCAERLGGV